MMTMVGPADGDWGVAVAGCVVNAGAPAGVASCDGPVVGGVFPMTVSEFSGEALVLFVDTTVPDARGEGALTEVVPVGTGVFSAVSGGCPMLNRTRATFPPSTEEFSINRILSI